MALVKAGPKKRRAKSEAEAIREAVEEHGSRSVRSGRNRFPLRTYSYKPVKKKESKRKLSLDKTAEGFNDRNNRTWQPWEEAILFVEATKVLDTLTKNQMQCDHKALRGEKAIASLTEDQTYRRCPDCQVILRWWGNYTQTIQAEWMQYRVEGYGMPEWGELFTTDKALWLFILEEAQLALTDEGGSE